MAILGRQSAISLAELESVYGSDNVRPVNQYSTLLSDSPQLSQLGGVQKTGKVLATIKTKDWANIEHHLGKTLQSELAHMPTRKINVGISTYGLSVTTKQLQRTSLSIKKVLKTNGFSVRLVPNTQPALSSAQSYHNHLTADNGIELLVCADKNNRQLYIAKTTEIQNIDAYRERDQRRPKRDARVGMLPPKLAQIIVNMATGSTSQIKRIIDPFCGTGVILQEALLKDLDILGSDLHQQMVDYTLENLRWITQTDQVFDITQADATDHHWSINSTNDAIAAETYLGRPFSSAPNREAMDKVTQDVDTIIRNFLRNVARQTRPGFRMCIAVPAWHTGERVTRLKTLEQLDNLGYNRVSFVHATDKQLIYRREDQVVGRELVTLIRK